MSTIPGLFPACAVTRAAARRAALQISGIMQSDNDGPSQEVSGGVRSDNTGDDKDSVHANEGLVSCETTLCSKEQLILTQEGNAELCPLIDETVSEDEVHKYANCFYRRPGVLMRKRMHQLMKSGRFYLRLSSLRSFEEKFCT